jgi:hypothetical protein
MTVNVFEGLQRLELAKARAKFPPINSAHEGYGVIMEEICEFFDEVRDDRRGPQMLAELVQIAAMAQRCAEDLGLTDNIDVVGES